MSCISPESVRWGGAETVESRKPQLDTVRGNLRKRKLMNELTVLLRFKKKKIGKV